MPGENELRHELEVVRKGRGVQEPQIRDRMGPALRRLCGVGTGTSHGEARRALVARLDGVAVELPGDLRLAARTMFALTGTDPRHRFLRQRYDTLSTADHRTPIQMRLAALKSLNTELQRPLIIRQAGSTTMKGGTGMQTYLIELLLVLASFL